MVNHAKYLERSFISVNRLKGRRSDFAANDWIMDSGAFTELLLYGKYRYSVDDYIYCINRWSNCGNLECAISQDYMCEPFILSKTGLSIVEHQQLTIERFDQIIKLTSIPIMPVLQGFEPKDYINHLFMYGERIKAGIRVGVGSICKRNGNPTEIIRVLESIKQERPDLKLHGFGLKKTSLQNTYITSLLYSADSMAWSYAARKQGRNANGLEEALRFYNKIIEGLGKKPTQLRFIEKVV